MGEEEEEREEEGERGGGGERGRRGGERGKRPSERAGGVWPMGATLPFPQAPCGSFPPTPIKLDLGR